MVRKDGAEIRRERIEELKKKIATFQDEQVRKGSKPEEIKIPLKRFVAVYSVESGLTPSKVSEYLELLMEISIIEVVEKEYFRLTPI